MTNDLTTLSGALLEMKDELIYQLEQKGVTASYSSTDGLLGLIGRIEDIQTGGGGSTTLFEDACSSATGLSNYGSSECVRGSNATITMTYDSTENAYKLSGTGNYHAMIPIPTLNDKDNYTITADFKGQNIHFNGIGFFLDNRNDTTSYGQAFWLSVYDKKLNGCQFRLSSDGSWSNGATNSSISANTWYTLEMTVNEDILYAKLYDGNTVLSQSATSLTVENRQMGLFLYCETGSTNSICYVKNIVAKTIGSGGSCYHIELDEDSYVTSDDSFTVSATLQSNYAPLSGATVTFSGGASPVTATTNSNGVATATVTFTSNGTLTATYSSVSDSASVTVLSLLYYDACDSASGLSNYGSSVAVRGSGSSMSMSYDSTENAYKCSGSGNWYSIIPIPILNDTDNYIIEADFKIQNISETGIGLCVDNRNDSTSNSYACWIEGGSGKYIGKQFNLNTDGTVHQYYGLNLSSSKWYRIEMIIDGASLTGNLYDGDTLISTDSTTLTVNNSQMGIFLMTQNGTTNSACWVKNIKVKNIYAHLDKCQADNTSAYTQKIIFADNNPSPTLEASLTYNSNGYYVFAPVNTSDNFCGFEIPNTFGADNIRLRAKVMLNSSSAYCQFGFGFQTVTYNEGRERAFFRIRGDNNMGYLDGTHDGTLSTSITQRSVVRILEIERKGGTVTINEYDESENLLYTTDYTLQNTYAPSDCYYFFGRNMKSSGDTQNIYEISAELL